jgi:hypothetical protein
MDVSMYWKQLSNSSSVPPGAFVQLNPERFAGWLNRGESSMARLYSTDLRECVVEGGS